MFKRGAMRLGLALAGVLALVVYLRTRPAEPHGSAFAIVTSAGAITPQPAASFAVVESGQAYDVRALWSAAEHLYAVGDHGTILH